MGPSSPHGDSGDAAPWQLDGGAERSGEPLSPHLLAQGG